MFGVHGSSKMVVRPLSATLDDFMRLEVTLGDPKAPGEGLMLSWQGRPPYDR